MSESQTEAFRYSSKIFRALSDAFTLGQSGEREAMSLLIGIAAEVRVALNSQCPTWQYVRAAYEKWDQFIAERNSGPATVEADVERPKESV